MHSLSLTKQFLHLSVWEGGRGGGRGGGGGGEGGVREGGREGGREGRREGREGGREGREGLRRANPLSFIQNQIELCLPAPWKNESEGGGE